MKAVERLFLELECARRRGRLIQRVSQTDKEFHFQNWVEQRLAALQEPFDDPSRNTYPDFRLVNEPVGFEVKGLAWPGRDADYDSNSQVPAGWHNNREIYYVFGRYPKEIDGLDEYPVTDLVVCHGSFLNADHNYVHKNDSFRGFGSYGDILIRDRKMYVVPTPFALMDGTAGLSTLIVPRGTVVDNDGLVKVGDLVRTEVAEVVSSYEFDLNSNELIVHKSPNPSAGREHAFSAYRSRGDGDDTLVAMAIPRVRK